MKKHYTPTKHLKDFPIEILEKIEEAQVSQGQEPNVEVIDNDIYANSLQGGFNWAQAGENFNLYKYFWFDVLIDKNFDMFFKHFPKNNNVPVRKSNEINGLKFKTSKR